VKLGSNENVLGPSPQAIAAVEATLTDAHLYPGKEEAKLLQKLAARLGPGLTEAHFTSGNGSCDVLRMISQTYINSGHRALIAGPTFGMYEVLVNMFGGQSIVIPLRNYTIDLPALLQAIDDRVRLIFIANPNNPTGTIVKHDQVRNFLKQVPPHVTVIFDEAYMEFADDPDFPDMLEFIKTGFNIIVTRTFSKLHGLASLRIGYGIARPELMVDIKKRKIHFNSGRLAYLGAAAAVNDDEHISATLRMVKNGRDYFYREFEALELKYIPSHANFIFLTDPPLDAAYICEEAMRCGVIIRQTDSFGLPQNIRITVGRQEDNERVIEVLKIILARVSAGVQSEA
ncbi:MAG: histidinol-phosphate transaminase, partial [Planctomycetes bacterium]|nr:histidinol-phosphate transaminase [Planctomycetota bacterium]